MRLIILWALFAVVSFTVEAGDDIYEIIGRRSIKSVAWGTHLRAVDCGNDIATEVDLVPQLNVCEMWEIEQHGENISLMPIRDHGKYLRHYTSTHHGLSAWHIDVLWKPIKHADGSWSLQQGRYFLSARKDEVVRAVSQIYDAEERFWINAA